MLTKDSKKATIDAFKKSSSDVGSAVVQIALLTERINRLAEHFNGNPKDHGSKRGFLKLVGQRRKLMNYVRKHKKEDYRKIVEKYKLK